MTCALKINPRHYYDMSVRLHDDNVESHLQSMSCTVAIGVENETISLVRTHMQGTTIDSSLVDTIGMSKKDEEF